jgi:hypothetical protein
VAIFSLKDLRAQVSPEWQKASDEELVVAYAQSTGQDAQQVAGKLGIATGRGKGSFSAGLGMGADQAQAMLAGTGAAIADVVGATGLRDTLERETRQQQAQSFLARNPETPQRIEDVGGIGEFGSYVAGQLGQQALIMGGIVGSSALGTLAGGPVGGVAAGLGAGYTYGAGSLYNEALEGGERKTGESLLKAIPYAAAESLVPLGLGRVARGALGKNLLTAKTRKGAITQAVTGGAITEAATEAFQTSLEIGMRDNLSPEEIYSRYLNAAVSGGIVGGGFSGVAGTFAKLPEKDTAPDADTTDTATDTGLDDTTPANNVVPDAEGGVNLAGTQEEVDANSVAQEQAPTFGEQADALAQQAIPDLLAIEQSLKEQAGRKLSKGGEIKLKNKVKRLQAALKTSTGDTALGQQKNLNAALADLQAHEQAVGAKAALARLEEGITPDLYAAEQGMFASLREELLPLAGEAEADTVEAVAMQGDLAQNLAALSEAEADMSRGGVPYDVLSDARQRVERSRETSRRQARAKDALLELDALERDGLPAYISQPIEARKKALKAALAEQRKGRAEVVPQAVEAVSPVQEAVAEPVQEAVAEPVQEVEAVSPVQEVVATDTDELLTEQEVEAALTPEEDAAVDEVIGEVNKLSAVEAGVIGEAAGFANITMPQQVLKGIAEMMRMPRLAPKAVVRKEGSPAIDKAQTAEFGEDMQAIHAAVHKAAAANRVFLNYRQNTVAQSASKMEGLDDPASAKATAQADFDKLQKAGEDAQQAYQDLVSLMGTEKNVEALVAIYKKSYLNTQNRGTKRDPKIKEVTRELFNSRDADSKGAYLTKLDVNFSNGWATYKDQAFTGVRQTAPEARTKRLSFENESKKFVDDLRTASETGAASGVFKGQKETGLIGVLNRVAQAGSGTGRTGTRALRKVLTDTFKTFGVVPDVRIEGTQSYFDPNEGANGTVVLSETETTPEKVIHEALHAALQGYVYRNPQAAEVQVLKQNLMDVIDFVQSGKINKARMAADAKAKAVRVVNELQAVLGPMKKDGTFGKQKELDAVLELISYGNTLAEFKELTTQIKARDAQSKTFLDSINSAWRYLTELVAKMLGVKDTVANDILNSTVSLLNKASQDPKKGKVVKGTKRLQAKTFDKETDLDLKAYGVERTYGFTKPIFQMLGAVLPKGTPAKLKNLVIETRNALAKQFPGLERTMRKFDPMVMFSDPLQNVFKEYKGDKHTTVQLTELVATDLRTQIVKDPQLANEIIAYMDGTKTALTGGKNAVRRDQIDSMKEKFDENIAALPKEQRDFFATRKFSEALIFVTKNQDIGSGTLGQRKLSALFGSRTKKEDSLISDWVGDASDKADYYQVMAVDSVGNPEVDTLGQHGFASGDIALKDGEPQIIEDSGKRFTIDPSVKWRISSGKGGSITFTSNKTVKEARDTLSEQKAADEIHVALLNTAHTISTYSASGKFLSGLASMGRDAKGNLDPKAIERGEVPVVFEDIAEYNAYLEMTTPEGETFTPYTREVPKASAPELKADKVADQLRATGTFIRLPDTDAMKQEELPIKIWGDLAGKIVSGPVYAAMKDMSNQHTLFNGSAMRNYNSALRQFKLSKTTRNLGTHATNVASNVTIMMMHGISFKTAIKAANILYNAAKNPEKLSKADRLLLKEFQKSGALLGNFSASEVSQSRYDEMAKTLNPAADNQGVVGRVAELLKLEERGAMKLARGLKDFDQNLLRLYAAEDNVFRMAAFMTRAGQLQAESDTQLTDAQWKQAGDFGRDAFLNYDIDAKYLQYARQTIMPFASWTYAAIPMLGRIALSRPWMIANVLTSYALVDAAMSALAGEDEEDRKRLGKMYNEKLFFGRGPNAMIRIPFIGDNKNPYYFKLGDYIPLASTFRGTPGGTFGYDWWPQGFSANGPLMVIAGAIMSADPYTGRTTKDPTESLMDTSLRNIGLMYDTFAPPMASNRNIDKFVDMLQGDKTIAGRDISPLFAARALGLKVYDPDPTEQSMFMRSEVRRIKRDYGIAISRLKREEGRSGAPDYDRLYENLTSLREDMLEEIDKVYGKD